MTQRDKTIIQWLIGLALLVIVVTTVVLGDYWLTLGVMAGWLIAVWLLGDWPKPPGLRRRADR